MESKMKRSKAQFQSTGALILGNLLFGLVPVLQKWTFPYGGSGMLTGFYSTAIALLPLALLARKNHISLKPEKETASKLMILSAASACTTLLLWSSYSFIPVGVATTLHYIYPMLIALVMTVVFHETFSAGNGIALLLALGGVALIGMADLSGSSRTGLILALASGCTWAFYIVYLKRSGLSQCPVCLVNFYITLLNLILSFFACFMAKQLKCYTVWWAWLVVIAVGLLHRVAAYGLFQIGMRGTGPLFAGILCTFEPASALVFGLLLLGEGMVPKQAFGLFCIFLGVGVNLYTNAKKA